MPKRTNEFQQLIYSIQHQLAGGAVVTESKILIDVKTNEPTEVDIVVESIIAEIPLVMGIECTAEGRPATVEWVREMSGKHANLKIDKTVLVAKSGFTPKAIKTAQANGVEAITLVEAQNTKWVTLIEQLRDLKLARFTFKAVSQKITFKVIYGLKPPSIRPFSLIHVPGKDTSYPLKDYVGGIVRYGPLAQEVMRRWIKTPNHQRKKEYEIDVTWKCPEGTMLQSDDAPDHPISDIEIKIGINVDDTPLELKSGQFVTTQVAYGTAQNILNESECSRRKVLVTLFSKEGKLGAGTLLIPAFGKEDGRIYSLKLPRRDTEDGETNKPECVTNVTDKKSDSWRALTSHGTVFHCAQAAGVSRNAVYRWRQEDFNFAEARYEAHENALTLWKGRSTSKLLRRTRSPLFSTSRLTVRYIGIG